MHHALPPRPFAGRNSITLQNLKKRNAPLIPTDVRLRQMFPGADASATVAAQTREPASFCSFRRPQ
jgi:hypothetical protein